MFLSTRWPSSNQVKISAGSKTFLLYEYKDLFIDMDVRKNHSELAIQIGIKNDEISLGEKSSSTAFDWTNDVFSLVKIYRSAF